MLRNLIQRLSAKIIVAFVAGILALGAGALGFYAVVQATESTEFCGELCHPMYPEYTVFEASPHSSVECARCHVGPGVYALIGSKARGTAQLWEVIRGDYNRPIPSPVETLRPARETCEECHWPQKFSGDLVRSHATYQPDELNTRQSSTVVLKVGGGQPGLAAGIHWHIGSDVWYVPMDDERLQIGWVGVDKGGGELEEWVNPRFAGSVTRERIQAQKRLMDCIDCHNRATHIFNSPDRLVDLAMRDGAIDSSLPFIKKKALEALDPQNGSLETAYDKVEGLRGFYRLNYPDIYQKRGDVINQAIIELRDVARLTSFADMKVDWNTHADHSGHNKPTAEQISGWDLALPGWEENRSDGCFRCHGALDPVGANLTATGWTKLDVSCNLCHYSLPSGQTSPVARAITHPTERLENCLLCHGASGAKPYPSDHPWSTNAACGVCHEGAPVLLSPTPAPPPSDAKPVPHETRGLENCLLCHGNPGVKPVGARHAWSTNDTCLACHSRAAEPLPLPPAVLPPGYAPVIPHVSAGLAECLVCHGTTGPRPFPATHPWATRETCGVCHAASQTPLPLPPAPTAPVAPSVTHGLQGLPDCRSCHGTVAPLPAGHAGIPGSFCTLCHRQGTVPAPAPTPITAIRMPHSTQGLPPCTSCHRAGGPAPFPPSHAGRTDGMCLICHAPRTTTPTPTPTPPGTAPAVTTGAASNIGTTSVTVSATLTSLGGASSVNVSFQWGTAPAGPFPNETGFATMGTPATVQVNITGLSPGTTYYYRAKAVGSSTVYGAVMSFTTRAV